MISAGDVTMQPASTPASEPTLSLSHKIVDSVPTNVPHLPYLEPRQATRDLEVRCEAQGLILPGLGTLDAGAERKDSTCRFWVLLAGILFCVARRWRPAFALSLALITTGCNWTMYRGNAQRTGRTVTVTSQNQGKLFWSVTNPGFGDFYIASGPVIGPGPTIYAGGNDGRLYAFNSNGGQEWAFDTGGPGVLTAAGIASDGTIYATNGNLFAVNSNGTLRWRFVPPGPGIPFEPAIGSDGTLYFGDQCGTVYAMSPTGTINWKFIQYSVPACENGTTIGQPAGTPAVASDGTIYIPIDLQSNGVNVVLVALTPSGNVKWISGFGGQPAVSSTGAIYFTTQDPATFKLYLTALNAAGSLQWQLNFPCCGGFTPAIAADGTIFLGTGQGLWAVNPDGSMKWQFRTDLVFGVPTIGGDGTIYAPVSGGTIFMAVNSNGTLKWTSDDWSSVDACGVFVNEPAIGPDGTIYLIPENDGNGICNPNGPLLAFH